MSVSTQQLNDILYPPSVRDGMPLRTLRYLLNQPRESKERQLLILFEVRGMEIDYQRDGTPRNSLEFYIAQAVRYRILT